MNDRLPATANATSRANQPALPKKRDCSNGNRSWFKPGVAQLQKHGMSDTLTYKVWTGIISRCSTPSATGFKNYGGRGIRVCSRWLDFENFISDMGEKPAGMSIDRIDSNGDYSPENCRWATRKEQGRNKRGTRLLTHNGKTQCVSAWAEESGVSAATIIGRLKNGWTVEKAIGTPARAHKEYSNART